jgi:quercetin dioxygenase-like cupin family protein
MPSSSVLRVAAALAFLVAVGPAASQPRPVGTTRSDLQRHDLSAPGREVLQARVDFAPGSFFPRHKHPGEEIIYVIEGTLEYELEGRGWVTLTKGDVLFVPDGGVHAARNRGNAPAAELATYVLVKGKPLTQFVQ